MVHDPVHTPRRDGDVASLARVPARGDTISEARDGETPYGVSPRAHPRPRVSPRDVDTLSEARDGVAETRSVRRHPDDRSQMAAETRATAVAAVER